MKSWSKRSSPQREWIWKLTMIREERVSLNLSSLPNWAASGMAVGVRVDVMWRRWQRDVVDYRMTWHPVKERKGNSNDVFGATDSNRNRNWWPSSSPLAQCR